MHNQKQIEVSEELESNAFQDRLVPGPVCDPKLEANLISSCPDTAVEENRDLCHSNTTKRDVDSIFPVTDSLSGYHFRNVHCWKCFNQTGQPLRWSVDLAVPVLKQISKDQLDVFLDFVDQNAVLANWKPPIPFTYPECAEEEQTDLNCTVCVPDTDSNGLPECSYVGRYQFQVICFACNSHTAQHQLDVSKTCLDRHYREMVRMFSYVITWPNPNNRDELLIEREKSNVMKDWLSCSVGTGSCVVLACQYNTFLVNGNCSGSYMWVAYRLTLCQDDVLKMSLGECFRTKRNGGFLSKQHKSLKQMAINLTALDDFSNGLQNIDQPSLRQCHYEISERPMNVEVNELVNLTAILTDQMNAFLSAYYAVAHMHFLDFELEERRDSDTLQLTISGWSDLAVLSRRKLGMRAVSLVIKTLMNTGIESEYIVCLGSESIIPKFEFTGDETCIPVQICFEKDLEGNEVSRADLDKVQVQGSTVALVLVTTMMSLLL